MPDNLKLERGNVLAAHLLDRDEAHYLKQLYDQAPCGCCSLNGKGVLIRVNQTGLSMLGYTESEILHKKKLADLIYKEDQQRFKATFARLKQLGWIRDCEFQITCENGSLLPISISASEILDEAGNYLMSSFFVTNISERVSSAPDCQSLEIARQRSDLALETSYQHIMTIWESMTDAYTALDFDWRIIYTNSVSAQMLSQLTGLKAEELLGKNHWEIFPSTVGTIVETEYKRAIAEQVVAHFEILYEPTGNWFEVHAYPAAMGLGVYYRDITDRKTAETQLQIAESRLRYLLSANPAVIYACQASGDYAATFVSENIMAMLGYGSQAFVEDSQFWSNRIHPEDSARVFAGLAHLFDEGLHTHEYRFLHQDGDYRWVRDECKLVRDADGNPLEIVGYWSDITIRKQSEEQIREQSSLLNVATDAIFVHDFNNHILFWNKGAEQLYSGSCMN